MSAPIISLAEERDRRRRRAEYEAFDAERERRKLEAHERLRRLLYGDDELPPGGHAA
jgi:hypothetical protein